MIKKSSIFGFTIIFSFIVFFELSCFIPTPESAPTLPEQIPIQKAKVELIFSSTKNMRTIGLLPFSNAIEYDDSNTHTLYANLIDKFRSKHPEYSIISPQEINSKIVSNRLSDKFNIFLGDYINTGVVGKRFIRTLKKILNLDAILLGKIKYMGSYSYKQRHYGYISKRVSYTTEYVNKLGICLACYRGKDGRKMWEGEHILREKAGLPELSAKLATIFATYFGRSSNR